MWVAISDFQMPNNLLSAFQYIFQQTLAAWRTVFLIVSALYVCSVTQFLIFAKAAVQPWNTYWENEPKKNDIKEKPWALVYDIYLMNAEYWRIKKMNKQHDTTTYQYIFCIQLCQSFQIGFCVYIKERKKKKKKRTFSLQSRSICPTPLKYRNITPFWLCRSTGHNTILHSLH